LGLLYSGRAHIYGGFLFPAFDLSVAEADEILMIPSLKGMG